MHDEQRIPATERHTELREQIAQAAYEAFAVASASKIGQLPPFDSIGPAKQDWLAVADAVLPFIEQAKAEWTPGHDAQCDDAIAWHVKRERVRVVEGLAATIKALREWPFTLESMYPAAWRYILVDRADVLAVVEAAREDT